MNKSKFSEIEHILSKTHRSANVIKLSKKKLSGYKLPDFIEMSDKDTENLFRRISKLDLDFEPKFVIQVDDGLIIFDSDEIIKGYTYDFGSEELFNEFEVESDDSPSHTIDHIMEMQKMMNQHFRRSEHE